MGRRAQAFGLGLFGLVLAFFPAGCGDDDPSSAPDVTPPGRVLDLRVVQRSAVSARLRWTAPGDDEDEGRASLYDLRRSTYDITLSNWPNTDPVSDPGAPRAGGSPESLVVGGLVEGVKYYFALRAIDEAGNTSRPSNTASLVIDVTPPGPVSAIEVTATSRTSVALAWTSGGDDGAIGVAAAYDVRYTTAPLTEANWDGATGAPNEAIPLPAGSRQEFVVSGLDPGTPYWFAVRALDERGNVSPLSDVVSATTAP